MSATTDLSIPTRTCVFCGAPAVLAAALGLEGYGAAAYVHVATETIGGVPGFHRGAVVKHL